MAEYLQNQGRCQLAVPERKDAQERRTHPATTARLLWSATSERLEVSIDAPRTNITRITSFQALLLTYTNATTGHRSKKQKVEFMMKRSVRFIFTSE
jgi:hypothetical protein